MPITVSSTGSFQRTEALMQQMAKADLSKILENYGLIGVAALKSVTPVDTGGSASKWIYKVTNTGGKWNLEWHNTNLTSNGIPVVVLLEFGHGTGTGGYVAGKKFIKPTIEPIFARIIAEVRREVTRR